MMAHTFTHWDVNHLGCKQVDLNAFRTALHSETLSQNKQTQNNNKPKKTHTQMDFEETCFKKNINLGWKDGAVAKNTGCSALQRT